MRRREFLRHSISGLGAALAAPHIAFAQNSRVLRYRPNNDLTVLDPIYTSAFVTRFHAHIVFDTLYGQDNALDAHPQMVEGHNVEEDGLLWRLKLRDGLRFHDGESVLARDVVASVRRWARVDAFGQALMAATDELSASSDNEVRFRLKRPFPLLPAALGKSSTFVPVIMPERLAAADVSRPLTEVVGSGPYRFVPDERVIGQRTVYERFAGYIPRQSGPQEFTAAPKIAFFDRIEWRVIPDPATATAALRAGEIDWYENPISDLLPLLRADSRLVVDTIDKLGNMGIVRFNHLYPPFDKPEIRRVAMKALNQTEIMEGVAGDTWSDKVGVFCPESPMASDAGIASVTARPDYPEIKRDLQKAGYNGEKVVFLDAPSSPGIHMQAEVASDQLRRAGMDIDYVSLDFGNWLQRRNNREAPSHGGWNCLTTFLPGQELWDPAGHLALRGNKEAAWSGWPDSSQLEALREQWFAATDEPARKAICRDMQLQAFQDVPYVPSGRWTSPTAYRRGLTGVSRYIPIFYNVKWT
jgi:peptide/nickel transport system substrate-binding protein